MSFSITYNGMTYDAADVVSGTIYEEMTPMAEQLGYGTLEVDVKSASDGILTFQKDSPVALYLGADKFSVWYLQGITRLGPSKYRLSAVDVIGRLSKATHYGGLYDGADLSGVLEDVCGGVALDLPDSVAGAKVYGWLPIASRRDNLQQILFSTGYYARPKDDGGLAILELPPDTAWNISKIGSEATAEYAAPVTKVVVTEHQYSKVTSVDAETLFDGKSGGSRVTFSGPYHSLAATGFTIEERGVNYAILGSGTGTLTGKPYVHTTREVTRTLDVTADENEAKYPDATLVSSLNSDLTAERLMQYHQSNEVVTADVRFAGQRPGQMASVFHPFTRQMASAYIESSEVTVCGHPKSKMTFRVGYVPSSATGLTHVVVLTADGDWTVPDGVTRIRAVLIGGGDGGAKGKSGSSGSSGTRATATSDNIGTSITVTQGSPGRGGSGGDGGDGGDGGKIKSEWLSVTPGDVLSAGIGAGGAAGSQGGDSTLTAGEDVYTSADGASDEGFYEAINAVTYGKPGQKGVNGASGGSGTSGTGSSDWGGDGGDVQSWSGGAGSHRAYNVSGDNHILPAGGGGAAYGNDGEDASSTNDGGRGASAIASGSAPSIPGTGGTGGNGGGGGGGGGAGYYNGSHGPGNYYGSGGRGGSGSSGTAGAPGCVIIYY